MLARCWAILGRTLVALALTLGTILAAVVLTALIVAGLV